MAGGALHTPHVDILKSPENPPHVSECLSLGLIQQEEGEDLE